MMTTHWNPYENYDFSLAKKGARTCDPAQEYEALLQKEYHGLDHASLITVNQLKIFTTDKFFEYQWQVSQLHKDKKDRRAHRCVAQIYCEFYESLLARARQLAPPLLFKPPKPLPPSQPPPPMRLAGMTWGERFEEEN